MDLGLDFTAASAGTVGEGDLLLTPTGDLATVDLGPEIGQVIVMRLRWFAGEWFLDTSLGVPWLTDILGQSALSLDGEAALQNTILTTPGVLQVLAWSTSLNKQTRALTVSFTAQVTTGIVSWNGTLAIGMAS